MVWCHIKLDWCHFGINIQKGDSDFCLLGIKMLRSDLSVCELKPNQTRSQSQDLLEEGEGSVLAQRCWTGLRSAVEEAGHSPRNILSFRREQGIHIYHSMGSHSQALPLDINICMTCADTRDPIISHSNSS